MTRAAKEIVAFLVLVFALSTIPEIVSFHSTAGLGAATEPQAVGHAVTAVYFSCWVPFGLAALFMFRFIHLAMPSPAPRRPMRCAT